MTAHDRLEFAKAMMVLGETFNEHVSTVRAAAYFDALSDLTIEQVMVAIHLATRTVRMFPRPIDLRELIEGSPDANADTAWCAVMEEIRRVGYMGTPTFSDERTLRSVHETWGSWRQLCKTLPGEGPELVGWMKQFKHTFQSLDRRALATRLDVGTVHPKVLEIIRSQGKCLPSERSR